MPASPRRRVTSSGPKRLKRLGVEVCEGAAEIVALAQDRQPGQAGLKAFEAQLLEQVAVVVGRPAPFLVVVGLVERIAAGPRAAQAAVGTGDQALGSCRRLGGRPDRPGLLELAALAVLDLNGHGCRSIGPEGESEGGILGKGDVALDLENGVSPRRTFTSRT